MNSRRKIVTALLFAAGLGFIFWNLHAAFGRLQTKLQRGRERAGSGREFTCGRAERYGLVSLAEKFVKGEKEIFLWSPKASRNDPGVEADIYYLAYFLYPAHVFYKDEAKIGECDFAISQNGIRYSTELALQKSGLSGKYRCLGENGSHFILKIEK